MADCRKTEIEHWRARAQELEQTQWDLERRIFQLETLAAIAREAGACHDLPAAARSVLNVLSGTLGAVSGAVLLYDPSEDTWRVAAARGIAAAIPDPVHVRGSALLDWLTAHPYPQSPAKLAGAGLEPLIAVIGSMRAVAPILHQGEPMGLILLGAALSGDGYTPADLALCAAAAASAATLISDILSTERFLAQQQERFHIQGIFEQYCAPDVVERLLAEHQGLRIGVEQKVVSVLMADLRGFTGMVQRLPPRQVEAIVNAFFTLMNDAVFAHRGTMDKFMGDAVMAVFGDPVSGDDDAGRAVRCAVAMQERFAALVAEYDYIGLDLGLGIGVTTGTALCGLFGSPRRFQYTVMGPPVNLAARLSGLMPGSGIFIDRYTQERLGPNTPATPLPPTRIRGFEHPIAIYRLEP